jgi:hypothetical protein
MNRVKTCLLAAAVVIAPLAASTSAEASPPLHCGATLTHNASLTHNLNCTSGDGLTLGPNVTLNLHGYTLRGSQTATGITTSFEGTNVIKNGRITNWRTGVVADVPSLEPPPVTSSGTTVISKVKFDHNATGVDASAGDIGSAPVVVFHIYDSQFSANGSGVGGLVARASIARSSFRNNTTGVDFDTADVTATKLQMSHNQTAFFCVESRCTLTKSVLRDNPVGVEPTFIGIFTLSGTVITGSTTAYNGFGFSLTHVVTGNLFAHNTTAVNIDAGQGSVRGNVFKANGTAITASETGTDLPLTLKRNLLVRNGDAITIDDATGISVGANGAFYNSGWGIRVPNATDLGGNHAHHNGNSPQCVGVVC